jgi:AcrR family transcriptional regulator
MTHKRVSRIDRRRQLIKAAQHVLARQGLRGLTTRAITAEAGSSLASLHYAFESVDELLADVLRASLGAFREQVLADVSPADSLSDAVDGCLQRLWAVVLADETLQVQQYELTLHLLRRRESHLGAAQYRGYVSIVEDYLLAALSPEAAANQQSLGDIARLIAASVDGLILQHLVEPDAARTGVDLGSLRAAIASLATQTNSR